jgi:hypothetical protein
MSSVKLLPEVASTDFVTYKHWNDPGVVVCYSDGKIAVYTPDGQLFKEFDSGHQIKHCSAAYSSDEITIGSVDSKYLRIHAITNNSTALHPVKLINDVEIFDNPDASPTAFTQYTRLNKKMWVVGDSQGYITVFFHDGELQGKAHAKLGEIRFIEKYLQQLVVGGANKLGVFNTGSLEIGVVCEKTVYEIYSLSLDTVPSIVYASLTSGDIIVYDTRYSVNNSPGVCKAVQRFVSKTPGQVASIKGHLLSWGNGTLGAFNTSFLETDLIEPPQYYSLPLHDSKHLKTFKKNDINYVLIVSSTEYRIYEVLNPINLPQIYSGVGIDYGYIRIIAIVFAVFFIAYWKSRGRKSKKELEVEKLEKSLEELQKSMESTSKISEDLTKRFRNVEESTKHLSGFANIPDQDSD